MAIKPLQSQVIDLNKKIEGMAKHVKLEAGDAVAISLIEMETNAKLRSPVDTGRLRASNRALFNKQKLSGLLFNNTRYAAYQNFGTGKLVNIHQGWEATAAMFKGASEAKVSIKGNNFFSNAYDNGVKKLVIRLKKIIANATIK